MHDPALGSPLAYPKLPLLFPLSCLPRSPKAFEVMLRMSSNLSGFTSAHQLLCHEPKPFPVLPLD